MSLIDKIGNGVIGAGNSISQKAKDISEQSRINSELAKYKAQKEECFKKLGEAVYGARTNGREPEVEDIIKEIQVVDGFIKNLSNSLNDVRGVVVCDSCGQEIPRDSAFCPSCGKKLELPDSLECPKCRAKLEIGAKFCVKCGTKVG